MKKFLALLIVTLMLVVTLASCDFFPPQNTTPAHECEHACEECGKCLDAECAECTEKCEGHHECEHECETCGKCTDDCAEPECAAKCPSHYTLTLGEATINVDGGKAVGTLPSVPEVAGKTGKWMVDGVELTPETVYNWAEDKTAEAVYTAIVYNVVFKVDGVVVATKSYTVDNATVEAPAVPTKAHYTGAWESYTLTTGDVEVDAVYTAVEYTVTFKADGAVVGTKTYTVDNKAVEAPAVPAKDHYTGAWAAYELNGGNVEVNAVYTAVEYTVTFKADGAVVDTKTYTVANTTVEAPAVPTKAHYTGAWESYTLTSGNVEVEAVYTAVEYTVTFKADGETVGTKTYTVENATVEAPAVPEKEGYNGSWSAYKLNGGDVEVNAVYTIKVYTVTYTVNGNVVDTKRVEHGTVLEAPAAIVEGANYVTGWTLGGAAYDFASAVKGDLDLVATLAPWDPSFETEKGELSYYISNLNNASVMHGLSICNIKPWVNQVTYLKPTYSLGSYTNGHGTFNGLTVGSNGSDYAAVTYNLPSAFDLTKAETIVLKVAKNVWGQYQRAYVLLKNGDAYVNVNPYSVFYAGTSISGNPVTLGDVLNVNYLTGFVVVDVAKIMEATGWTTIDGISFGTADDPSVATHGLDEIYYTVGHDCASVCAECGKCLDPQCVAFSCAEKCAGHHKCEHVCEECGKCTDTCEEPECANKCEGHVYDPSYLTKKDENSYYISNFDNESVLKGVTELGIDPWYNGKAENGTVTHGKFTNAHYSNGLTGLNFAMTGADYTGYLYTLPTSFDLAQADKIVVKLFASGWHSGYANFFILVKSGDKYVNVGEYSQFYSGTDMSGTPSTFGSVININYLSGYAVIDVAALMEGAEITSIDGFVFGQKSTAVTHTVDEIYYTVPVDEINIEFTTSNVTNGVYSTEDTANGLAITCTSNWAQPPVQHKLGTDVDITEATTITFRFKGTAIMYFNYVSETTQGVYLNLASGLNDFKISSTTDEEGYTVLVIDAQKLREAKSIDAISLIAMKSSVAGTCVFDYVLVSYK